MWRLFFIFDTIFLVMRKTKPLFLIMLILEGLLFLLDGYSLIICFVFGQDLLQRAFTSSLFEMSYLFIQLIGLGIIFYITMRAYLKGSNIMAAIMVKDYNEKNIVAIIIAGVIAVISLLIGIYAILIVFGLPLPLYDYLGTIIPHCLMNAMLLLASLSICFFIFPFIYKEDLDKGGHNEKL